MRRGISKKVFKIIFLKIIVKIKKKDKDKQRMRILPWNKLDETWDIKEEWRAPDDEATPKEIQNSLFLKMIFLKKSFHFFNSIFLFSFSCKT